MTFADRTNAERLAAAKPGRMLVRWIFGAWQPIDNDALRGAKQ